MTGTPIFEAYSFDIRGNFAEQLKRLAKGVEDSRDGWKALRETVGGQDIFKKVKAGAKDTAQTMKEGSAAAKKLLEKQEALIPVNVALGKAYNQLVREQNRNTVSVARELQVLEQRRAKAEPRIIQLRAEARAVRAVTKALEDAEFKRAFAALAAEKGIDVSKNSAKAFNAEAEAARRLARATNEAAVAGILASQGRDARGRPAGSEIQGPSQVPGLSLSEVEEAKRKVAAEQQRARLRDYMNQLRGLGSEMGTVGVAAGAAVAGLEAIRKTGAASDSVIGKLLFTFRRLVGVFALFTIARQVVSSFNQMVFSAVQFNAAIERNRVGLAGLIAASSEVRDSAGERVGVEKQLNIAQNISIEQMRQLRADAIRTVATYEDLADAFSQSIAPGLSSGLNIDQIRQITVQISQAATGLGLAQNQLSEEIRALFQGTITPRNTRIATALGISNQDILRAKELGNLYGFLDQRFKAIAASGARLANTFAGQANAAADAFKQLTAEASRPLFEQLKATLQQINAGIFENLETTPTFRPEALQIFQGLFEGLAVAVRNIREVFKAVEIRGLADTLGLLGQALGTAGSLLASAFVVAFQAASPFVTLLKSALATINLLIVGAAKFNNLTNGWLSGIGLSVTKILALFFGLRKVASVAKTFKEFLFGSKEIVRNVGFATEVVYAKTGKLKDLYKGIVVAIGAWMKPLLLVLGAVAVIETLSRALFDFSVIDFLGDQLSGLFSKIEGVIGGLSGVREEASKPTGDGVGNLVNQYRELRAELEETALEARRSSQALDEEFRLTPTLGLLSSSIAAQQRDFAQAAVSQRKKFLEIEDAVKATQKEQLEIQKKIQEEAPTPRSNLALRGILEEQLKDARVEAERLNKQLEGLPNANTFGVGALEATRGDELKKREAAVARVKELETAIQGVVERQIKGNERITALQGQSRAAEEGRKKLLEEEARLRQNILETQAAQFRLSSRAITQDLALGLVERAIAAEEERLNAQSVLLLDQKRLESLSRQIAVIREQARLEQLQARSKLDIAEIEAQAAEFAKAKDERSLAAAKLQIEAMQKVAEQEQLAAQAAVDRAKAEAELAKKRDEGGLGDGLDLGLRQFASDNKRLSEAGAAFGQNLASVAGQFTQTAIRQGLVDGFSAAEAQQALQGLLADAVAQLAADLVNKVVSDLILSILPALKPPDPNLSGIAAAKAASAELIAASTTAASTIAGALTSGAAAIANAGLIAASAITTAAALARLGTLIPAGEGGAGAGAAIGAIAGGAARGGRIWDHFGTHATGFAHGGSSRRGRPLGMDPRDTIPAMLRKGEWVIRPEAVQMYGDRLFHMLNSMKLNPEALGGIAKAGSVPKPVPKRSFASGGAVVQSARVSAGGGGTVVQFHDEQTMDRALAAGERSMLRFVRRKRSAFRDAQEGGN